MRVFLEKFQSGTVGEMEKSKIIDALRRTEKSVNWFSNKSFRTPCYQTHAEVFSYHESVLDSVFDETQ